MGNPLYIAETVVPYKVSASLGISNLNDWHRFSWMAFPGGKSVRDFLFSVDEVASGYRVCLMSSSDPGNERLKCLGIVEFRCREIPDAFFRKGEYLFEVVANPVRRSATIRDGERIVRKVPITGEAELISWMDGIASNHGFKVVSLEVELKGGIRIPRPESSPIVVNSVGFRGTINVENPELFRSMLQSGIGSSKAFGFGLVKARPISS